jgi:predicted nucleic acid-binding protein
MPRFEQALERMESKRVYIDTNILIYFFNKEQKYFSLVSRFLQYCASRKILGVASELVVAEILVQPYRERNLDAVAQIKAFFAQKDFLHVSAHPPGFIGESAILAGERGMKLIDAMHLHTALSNRCDFLITHDGNFKSTNAMEVIQIREFVDDGAGAHSPSQAGKKPSIDK